MMTMTMGLASVVRCSAAGGFQSRNNRRVWSKNKKSQKEPTKKRDAKTKKKRDKKKKKNVLDLLSVVLYSYVCNYMSLQKSLSSIKIVGVVVLFSTTVRLSSVVSHAALSA